VGDAGDPDGSLAFPSDDAFRAYVSRLDGVMVLPKAAERRHGGSVRLFDPAECDLRLIALTLSVYPYDRGRRSAEELFANEAFAGIMAHAGVHNGYELHHVLTRHCGPIPGVTCGRSPMLEVG
jgi:hypothetical protein